MKIKKSNKEITLIGGGIMSLTLASLINELHPNSTITLIEKLNKCGLESSKGINNAGTGHAGFCELNYTPIKKGVIDINRALEIGEMFETSLQLWAYLDKKYNFFDASKFINQTPHISFVYGEENVSFLKKRFDALKKQPLFKGMQYTSNKKIISKWAPLLMHKRKKEENVAATKIDHGSDIDFGELTDQLLSILKKNKNFTLLLSSNVYSIKDDENKFTVHYRNLITKKTNYLNTDYIFIGAGGKAISLLQNMKLTEGFGYGGFPLSGKWLVCNDPKVIEQHHVKVYGQALPKSPPLSIPHLDLRTISGKKTLLFGPFAGFTSRFLKNGSPFDLARSIKLNNLRTLFGVLFKNFNLLLFLIKQSLQSHNSRMDQLKNFYPGALNNQWKLINAGQRVQILKKCVENGGKLEFGTEIIFAKNKKIAVLIGASPGASVSGSLMLNVIKEIYGNSIESSIKKIIPGYGINLNNNPKKLHEIRNKVYKQLNLWK